MPAVIKGKQVGVKVALNDKCTGVSGLLPMKLDCSLTFILVLALDPQDVICANSNKLDDKGNLLNDNGNRIEIKGPSRQIINKNSNEATNRGPGCIDNKNGNFNRNLGGKSIANYNSNTNRTNGDINNLNDNDNLLEGHKGGVLNQNDNVNLELSGKPIVNKNGNKNVVRR